MEQVAIEDSTTGRRVVSAVAFENVNRNWRVTAEWLWDDSGHWTDGSWTLTDPENVLVQFADGSYGVVSEAELPAALASSGQARV